MAYELKTEKFQGPLEKLLELIEERKLQVSEISLAEVTDDFLRYLEGRENIDFSTLADFISVASRLILIKSKSLLPDLTLSEEEEADIKDLERRLAFYQELKSAKKHFETLWNSKNHSHARQYMGSMDAIKVFYPGTRVTGDSLAASIARIFETVKKMSEEGELIREKIVSLEEKIKEVIKRVQEAGETSMGKLSHEKSKAEVIAIFLAILHLAREQLIRLEQTGNFSDIMIKNNEKPKEAETRAI
ncbi:MAG: ScpA family protein [Candidatus Liptonbacteria bacterium]|nr:ScpA family protein [Candidatus Liptonbacteria bacterium]